MAHAGPGVMIARAALLSVLVLPTALSRAGEGMWTFDDPPRALLEEKHGFTPTGEWLNHLRLASVRDIDGGSGGAARPVADGRTPAGTG